MYSESPIETVINNLLNPNLYTTDINCTAYAQCTCTILQAYYYSKQLRYPLCIIL